MESEMYEVSAGSHKDLFAIRACKVPSFPRICVQMFERDKVAGPLSMWCKGYIPQIYAGIPLIGKLMCELPKCKFQQWLTHKMYMRMECVWHTDRYFMSFYTFSFLNIHFWAWAFRHNHLNVISICVMPPALAVRVWGCWPHMLPEACSWNSNRTNIPTMGHDSNQELY